eukprot:COSAG05_NODE_2_length_63105_cov_159.292956_20_plen_114_part_00
MGGCLRPHDSLWDGAHDARLTGDVVDEILGGKVDRADWSVAPDDPRTGARPRPNPSAPYRAFCSSFRTGRNARVRLVFFLNPACFLLLGFGRLDLRGMGSSRALVRDLPRTRA